MLVVITQKYKEQFRATAVQLVLVLNTAMGGGGGSNSSSDS